MYFVPHFGHAKVYETSIWTPCFQISAKTLGCPKLTIVKFWGAQIFKRDHNILRFQLQTCMNLSKLGIISLYNVTGIIYGDEKMQQYAWDWHFRIFLTEKFGCPKGYFLMVWVSERNPDALLTKTKLEAMIESEGIGEGEIICTDFSPSLPIPVEKIWRKSNSQQYENWLKWLPTHVGLL